MYCNSFFMKGIFMKIGPKQVRQQEIRKKSDIAQKDLSEAQKNIEETKKLLNKDIDIVKSGRTFTA